MLVRIQQEGQDSYYYEYDSESRPLGKGGMGTVYLGYCFRASNRNEYIPVAIKTISDVSPILIQKAQREAAVRIDHPNLLRMWDFIKNSEYDGKTHYYVIMDALQGVSLSNLMEGNLTDCFDRPCEYAQELYLKYLNDRTSFVKIILTKVLEGLKALHNSGVIHRDLDPSNIMITSDREIKIIDFGISKNLSEASTGKPGLTSPGSMMGKIDYAAPEMITGDIDHHNYTTDIYCLGIMIYQLFTGNVPFLGDNSAIAKQHISSRIPIENIEDKEIREIIAKATEKKQEDRYQRVEDILDCLKVQEQPTHVAVSEISPDDPSDEPPQVKENKKGIATWIFVVCPILALILGFYINYYLL